MRDKQKQEIVGLDDIKEDTTVNSATSEPNKIWELLEVIPKEQHDELAELLVDFTQKNNLLLYFIAHTVQHEVYCTSK